MPDPNQPTRYPRGQIAVFAREPVRGKVKTRLIPAIGADSALALYLALTDRTLQLVQHSGLAPVSLWVSSNPSHEYFLSLCNKKDIFVQEGADLGQKMWACARAVLAAADTDYMLLIGTDCPALTANYLDSALAALASGHDWVLGPAQDGGYVLLGLRQANPEPFQDIEWGSAAVLAQTCAKLDALGLQGTLLAPLRDLDVAADLDFLADLQPPLPWP